MSIGIKTRAIVLTRKTMADLLNKTQKISTLNIKAIRYCNSTRRGRRDGNHDTKMTLVPWLGPFLAGFALTRAVHMKKRNDRDIILSQNAKSSHPILMKSRSSVSRTGTSCVAPDSWQSPYAGESSADQSTSQAEEAGTGFGSKGGWDTRYQIQ
jgi:hypothetical protein